MQAIPDMDSLVLCLWCGGYDSRLARLAHVHNALGQNNTIIMLLSQLMDHCCMCIWCFSPHHELISADFHHKSAIAGLN